MACLVPGAWCLVHFHSYWVILVLFHQVPAGFHELGESTAEGAARETLEEAGAAIEILAPYVFYDIVGIGQSYVLYRARLAPPFTFFAREPETLEARLFAPDEVPFDELAFSSVGMALRAYFADLQAGFFHVHQGKIVKDPGAGPNDPGTFKLVDHFALPTTLGSAKGSSSPFPKPFSPRFEERDPSFNHDDLMKDYSTQTGRNIPVPWGPEDSKAFIDWMDDCVVFHEIYSVHFRDAFHSYTKYIQTRGQKPLGKVTFGRAFVVFAHQLNYPEVEKRGPPSRFIGATLRPTSLST
jgi:ADP-ribose pyrophosphatase YjhB (NUDIX family)